MNRNTYIAIGAIVAVLAFVAVVLTQKKVSETNTSINPPVNPSNKMVTGSSIDTFSGTISAVDTGCFADAVCSVTIDGKKVILVTGGERLLGNNAVVGRLIGVDSIGDLEQKIGAFANVYAGRTPGGDYSIYGNSEYYVEVVDIGDK